MMSDERTRDLSNLPDCDREGFLRDYRLWTWEIAGVLAEKDGISLTVEHREVIELARDYYDRHGLFPQNRVLVSRMRDELGVKKGSSIHLMKLFSGKPARVLARLAGLPKPPNCD